MSFMRSFSSVFSGFDCRYDFLTMIRSLQDTLFERSRRIDSTAIRAGKAGCMIGRWRMLGGGNAYYDLRKRGSWKIGVMGCIFLLLCCDAMLLAGPFVMIWWKQACVTQ